jgi:hypothetical protein
MVGRGKCSSQEPGLSTVLSSVGLQTKFIVQSQSTEAQDQESLGPKVLGLPYNLEHDTINMSLKPKYSHAKGRGAREEITITAGELEDIRSGMKGWTRRQALSMVMGAYDPLGLLCPAMLQGKLLLRRLAAELKQDWDKKLPQKEKEAWTSWIQVLLEKSVLSMPHTVTPEGVVGLPRLVGYADESLVACCIVLYVVWRIRCSSGAAGFVSRILVPKSRVTPLFGKTVPRSELQALCILARIVVAVLAESRTRFCRVTILTDSRFIQVATAKPSSQMKPFFSNRVGEVNHLLREAKSMADQVETVSWIEGALNPADKGTRAGLTVGDLGKDQVWLEGPAFHMSPRDEWPTDLQLTQAPIPETETRLRYDRGEVNSVTATSSNQEILKMAVKDISSRVSLLAVAEGAVAKMLRRVVGEGERIRNHGSGSGQDDS